MIIKDLNPKHTSAEAEGGGRERLILTLFSKQQNFSRKRGLLKYKRSPTKNLTKKKEVQQRKRKKPENTKEKLKNETNSKPFFLRDKTFWGKRGVHYPNIQEAQQRKCRIKPENMTEKLKSLNHIPVQWKRNFKSSVFFIQQNFVPKSTNWLSLPQKTEV